MSRHIHSACVLFLILAVAGCASTSDDSGQATGVSRNSPVHHVNSRDVACVAEAVYFEARGTGDEGTRAVAHVVVNRARSPEFPNSVCGVVADRCQFSYRCDGRPDVLANTGDRTQATRIAQQVLTGAPDITKGALFFHAARMEPGWFSTRPKVGKFGGNIFYR